MFSILAVVECTLVPNLDRLTLWKFREFPSPRLDKNYANLNPGPTPCQEYRKEVVIVRAALHYGQGWWLWYCEGPWNSSQGRTLERLKLNCLWSLAFLHVQTLNRILFQYHVGFYIICSNKSRVFRFKSVVVFQFCVGFISTRWVWHKTQ